MIDLLKNIVSENRAFTQLLESARALSAPQAIGVTGLSGSFASLVLANLHEKTSRQLLVIAGDPEASDRLADDMRLLFDETIVRIFRGGQGHGAEALADGHGNLDDIETLRSLLTGTVGIVVTHPKAMAEILPVPSSLKNKAIILEADKNSGLSQTVQQLNEFGFEKVDFVETVGEYSVRGGILDVFPFVGEHPVRVEYFGDTIESIREFDPLSQRSIKALSTATIVPNLLGTAGSQPGHAAARSTLVDYMNNNAIVVLDQPDHLFKVVEEEATKSSERYIGRKELEELLTLFSRLHVEPLNATLPVSVDMGSQPQPSFNGSIQVLRENLSMLQQGGVRVFMTCETQSELARLRELLTDIEPAGSDRSSIERNEPAPHFDPAGVEFLLNPFHAGFIVPASGIAVYTEHQIFNRLKRRGRRRKAKFRGLTDRDVHQLHKGDYVVHVDYGIGRFDGLKKIQVRQVEQEVLKLLYAENDTLYVNLNFLNRIQKYSSKEGHIPKLTRLGSPDWERLKSKAKKRIQDIARDLIQLYARRKHLTGFSFLKDTAWQKELEASFVYEDTPDQAKATLDVKRDMEAPNPMDRLVCGDVGFGKTEVAVRAAFKAVLSGKQVAVLAPTTILALQHYNTFVDRTSRYGVRIQVISRFKSKKEQSAIIEQLKAGAIDIIIGTHRLLSKDVGFRDLGLLVIDEEHRFGVSAKEKLRQIKAQVDTLTLTATPIPRTLHFSLMGARDLSIMGTPPRNRLPIITEIAQYNDDLIRDAMLREIQRGGQVYVVHDRIQRIEEITMRLRGLLPQARIRFAHGQMHAHELENVMMEFLEKKFDVLVCTKIIESGLDIPNVNTIIINRADRFGMAELYQLRGRVGRSNVQAYAYLLTPPVSVLPKDAIQRLQALEEFTELGSGFNLAMRDLEIRGAGSLLGAEQSGYIETMGFETYTKILEEAVGELKHQEFQDVFGKEEAAGASGIDTVVETDVEALIPESYVSHDVERLGIYRQLYAVTTLEQLSAIRLELRDRFGTLPRQVENLLSVVQVRIVAGKIGFKRLVISRHRLQIDFPPAGDKQFYEAGSFQHLMNYISQRGKEGISLAQSTNELKLSWIMPDQKSGADPIGQSLDFLTRLQEAINLKAAERAPLESDVGHSA